MIIAAQSGEDGCMSDQAWRSCTTRLQRSSSASRGGDYDTTSGTLSFLLNYLARYPDEQEPTRQEDLCRHLCARLATRADLGRAPLAEVEAALQLRRRGQPPARHRPLLRPLRPQRCRSRRPPRSPHRQLPHRLRHHRQGPGPLGRPD